MGSLESFDYSPFRVVERDLNTELSGPESSSIHFLADPAPPVLCSCAGIGNSLSAFSWLSTEQFWEINNKKKKTIVSGESTRTTILQTRFALEGLNKNHRISSIKHDDITGEFHLLQFKV